MSNTKFQRLQKVQNAAARIVLFVKLHDANITQPTFWRSPLVTGAWQSRLQDLWQAVFTFNPYLQISAITDISN